MAFLSFSAIYSLTSVALPADLTPIPTLEERTVREKLFTFRCETLTETTGFSDTPTGLATKHSCDVPEVGIALYAGSDLGKHSPSRVGQYFIAELAKYNVQAAVFTKTDHEFGSSMAFYIDGVSYLNDPVRPSEALKLIEALAAETKLILLTKGRISAWPKSQKTLSR